MSRETRTGRLAGPCLLGMILVGWAGLASASAPVELGKVRWGRDVDAALRAGAESGRPVFALFQEVPGCQTCVGFGQTVLAHPLLVEAIESEFVAVAVLNNRGGADRAALRRFGEPAWNNPVVRFLSADGRDLIPRKDRVWSRHEIAARMVAALREAGRPVPPYLGLLAAEGARREAETATLGMYCFWQGEACLGDVRGVLTTKPAWSGGGEVVVVEYDPDRITYRQLLAEASRRGCAERVVVRSQRERRVAEQVFDDAVVIDVAPPRPAKASDDKRHLQRSPLRALELTPLQQTRVNAALAAGEDATRWLSPRQRAALEAR